MTINYAAEPTRQCHLEIGNYVTVSGVTCCLARVNFRHVTDFHEGLNLDYLEQRWALTRLKEVLQASLVAAALNHDPLQP